MSRNAIYLDSFTSSLAELPNGKRSTLEALRSLAAEPRVSTFDRGPKWIESLLADLLQQQLIVEIPAAYPWHRYALTDAGKEAIK